MHIKNSLVVWSINAWNNIVPIYKRIINHPFITELAAGTLSDMRFKFYIEQDVIYLAQLSKSISKLSSRFTDAKCRELFEKFAKETMEMEQSMQKEYALNFKFEDSTPKTLASIEYTNYEAYNVEFEDLAVALATILPCYLVYKRVGDYVAQIANLEGHKYAKWIALYSDEYFADEVAQFTAICDEYADNCSVKIREKMIEAFAKSAQFEYDFWNDAYNMYEV